MKENHLINESSPYLKQHAHNPVDWYPWGEEALSKAKKEDKPIIVSIGYSTCHWCHVMERESFENEQIAEEMNANFVCIKVDREERPDVDQVYMDAVGAMGQQGGWPLNVFLTPDKKPFYGGTYFPPQGWYGLLQNVAAVFKSKRTELEGSAEQYTAALERDAFDGKFTSKNENIDPKTLDRVAEKLESTFDSVNGGTSGAPKFPMPAIWSFLLQTLNQQENHAFKKQLFLTLDKMAFGGIYDQIGGGFARYSTDSKWFAPHFEKMLYDNGQLLSVYAKAFKIDPKPHYRDLVYQTVDWLKREMVSKTGGFYSALDADSEGCEGKFYVWKDEELRSALDKDYNLIKTFYNTTEQGNWENGTNILHRTLENRSFAEANNIEPEAFKAKIEGLNGVLLQKRSDRIRPGLDDKILLSWNALMSIGLIHAYHAFEEEAFLALAQHNVDFMIENMMEGHILFHSFGKKNVGFMDDYALFVEVLIEMYETTFNEKYLMMANRLVEYSIEVFFDNHTSSFFYTSRESERLIVDKKEMFDNVIPASNSIMTRNLQRLGTMLDKSDYLSISNMMLRQVHHLLVQQPQYMTNWAGAFHMLIHPPLEIIIVGKGANEIRRQLVKRKLPNYILMGSKTSSELPLLKGRVPEDGTTTIYICQNKVCQLPVQSVEDAIVQIAKLS